MARLSLRDIAGRDLGKVGTLSVNTEVYGYPYRDAESRLFGELSSDDVLLAPGSSTTPTARSLRQHLTTVSGTSIDLVIFLVGHEPDFSGVVTKDQVVKLQFGLQMARDIYAQIGLGIRRVEWGYITPEQAGKHTDIGSVIEEGELTAEFSGRPGATDIFAVQTMASKAGRSPVNGTCNKEKLSTRSGVVMELNQTPRFTGIVIGHETGHYLGLNHVTDSTDLMCGPVPFHKRCDPSIYQTKITADQARTMKEHCMIIWPA
jgi:hypothetical protein